VEYTQLGRTGRSVSRISYGTWQFGGDWGQVTPDQWETGKATVRKALELGEIEQIMRDAEPIGGTAPEGMPSP
jgi:hypothetical protein